MDTLWLTLRFVVSLAVVIGLIWGLARVKKRVSPKGAGTINLVSKVPVSKKGSLLLVEVGGKTMMLGATDTSITLLSVIDTAADIEEGKEDRRPVSLDSLLDEQLESGLMLDPDLQYPDLQYPDLQYPDLQYPDLQYPDLQYPDLQYPDSKEVAALHRPTGEGRLAGSVLSPTTWRQLTEVLREKTVRS
jgi:flagellar protein FliO/FliZ